LQEPPQQNWLNPAAKPNATVDFNNRHAGIESGFQLRIGVDVHQGWNHSVSQQQLLGLVAQMATASRVEDHTEGERSVAILQHR
jgi:hypothetical protein